MNNQDYNEIAQQLKCPSGEKGVKVAEVMFRSNSNMIYKTIDRLGLKSNDVVLEIGFGSAKHLNYVFAASKNLTYKGIELSTLMFEKGKEVKEMLTNEDIELILVNDPMILPFDDQKFNHCFTVNTIYFWPDPIKYLAEIFRVLKPGGSITITYIREDFLRKQPFAQEEVFRFYKTEWLIRVLTNLGYSNVERWEYMEETIDKMENKVVRPFVVLRGSK